MRNKNSPRQDARPPCSYPKLSRFSTNKHFSRCCLPLVNFKTSKMVVWAVFPNILIVF